jgi:hypothetical protein
MVSQACITEALGGDGEGVCGRRRWVEMEEGGFDSRMEGVLERVLEIDVPSVVVAKIHKSQSWWWGHQVSVGAPGAHF